MLYACRKVSMLTAFFSLCCVMSLKMTWRIDQSSGAMLYACKKVSMLTAMAQGEVGWVSFLSMVLYSVEISWAYVRVEFLRTIDDE